MALAMRCNCQMSFSSSFERPRCKLRSHRKRMDNTTRIGRPMASVARTMLKSSESRGVRDWVNGASKCRLLEAGYSSAVVMTNESTSGQAVRHSRLFFDWLDQTFRHLRVFIVASFQAEAQCCPMLGLIKANIASTGKPHLRS